MKKVLVRKYPWDQPLLTPSDVAAIKALFAGNASSGQQIRGMEVIAHEISRAHRSTFTEGGEDGRRATDFGEGCRWVGLTLLGICQVKLAPPRPSESGPHAVPKGAPPGE